MWSFIRALHNRRPLLWSVLAFIVVVATATVLSVWWNVLLVQNHRIVQAAAKAATDPAKANIPLALFMVIGILLSLVIVLGLVYMFLRLIRTVQLNLAQSQFIAAVTHELKSPVASLQIMLDTIRDPETPVERRDEFAQCMDQDLKRLRALVDQVLDTARLENFATEATREDIELKSVIDQCVDHLETRLITSGSKLKILPYDASLKVRANRRLLAHALGNVLDNGIKYSQGPADLTVDVLPSPSSDSVAIEVHDRGIGISRKELKRVFHRFYRARDAAIQAKPGTGLGLYFARLAIKAQGGNISVRSVGPGRGATVRLEIPLR